METPNQAIERLRAGNQRFTKGERSVEPTLSHLKLKELAERGQKPFAIVLTCSDSRSPAELIFDQGLGDLFVVRVAGNVVAPSLLGSIEFAATSFESPLILVLGHTLCGAVTTAVEHNEHPEKPLPSPHLEELISRIRPAVDAVPHSPSVTSAKRLELATKENVARSMRLIEEQSAIVRRLIQSGKLGIAGAILDVSTGKVNFLNS